MWALGFHELQANNEVRSDQELWFYSIGERQPGWVLRGKLRGVIPSIFSFLVIKKVGTSWEWRGQVGQGAICGDSDQDTGVGAAQGLMVTVEQPHEINMMGRLLVVKVLLTKFILMGVWGYNSEPTFKNLKKLHFINIFTCFYYMVAEWSASKAWTFEPKWTCVQIIFLLPTCCVTKGKLFDLLDPQVPNV